MATHLVRRGTTLLRWVGAVVSAAWIASAEFHLLSAFGAFRLGTALALTAFSAALAASVDALHDRLRPELARVGFVNSPVEPYWLRASFLVDEPGRSHRVAVTSGPWGMADNWSVYPFLGRRLQNRAFYVSVARDGELRHFGSPEVNEEYRRAADFSSWRTRLRGAGVTDVMSFSPAPIELTWMEDHPELFRRLTGDAGDWGPFALRIASPPREG